MKRLLFGILIGLLLTLPLSVAAAEVASIVGKRIEGTFPVIVGGERVATDAVVVNGISYAPIRAIIEKLGANVIFENGKIIVTPAEGGGVVTNATTVGSVTPEEAAAIAERNKQLAEEVRRLAEESQNVDPTYEIEIEMVLLKNQLMNASYNYRNETDEVKKSELKGEMDALEIQIADLQAQLAALEAEQDD